MYNSLMVNINDCVIDIGSNIYLTAPLFFLLKCLHQAR